MFLSSELNKINKIKNHFYYNNETKAKHEIQIANNKKLLIQMKIISCDEIFVNVIEIEKLKKAHKILMKIYKQHQQYYNIYIFESIGIKE